MSDILIASKDTGGPGIFAEANLGLLNMAALRLSPGETYSGNVGEHEQVTVVLGGRCAIRAGTGADAQVYLLGRRPDVFAGMPWALYMPRRTAYIIEAITEVEVASCWVPTDEYHPVQLVTPSQSRVEIRGGGNATRQINSILPPGFDCHRLVCVEVYTPPGNWSSYPPHKHDEHRVGPDGVLLEADLEEIYFYKQDRPEGFAYQRVYTADGRRDQLVLARNHDVVLVPEGYHPVVSGPGYTTYYLNFLAGSAQSLANSDDPAHAWLKECFGPPDPRVPIVHAGMEA
jgi:5-deoxy-glucuronate isomerase